MTIAQLDKMTLYGPETQKQAVIDGLQELGCAHLVNLSTNNVVASPAVSEDARQARKYLKNCREQRRQVQRSSDFDRESVVAEALRLQRSEEDLKEELDELGRAIKTMEPWGEFQLPDPADLGKVRFWFYQVPIRELDRVSESQLTRVEVGRDLQHAYLVVIDSEEPVGFPGEQVKLDRRPLSAMNQRREELEEQLEEIFHNRVGLTKWCDQLSSALDRADDSAAREHASELALDGDQVFALQGWTPSERAGEVREFAAQHGLAISLEAPRSEDEPPTLLENTNRFSGAEGLVTFYRTPAYRAWDPTIIAYLSFVVFFAMIIADAGYGLVFAVMLAFGWKRLGGSAETKRLRKILTTVVVATTLYGVLCGSYFGVSPTEGSALANAKIIDAESQELMMPLTILIGVVHLSIAQLVVAWLNRHNLTSLSSLGWVSVMLGSMLIGAEMTGDYSERASMQLSQTGSFLLIGGLLAVFLFFSRRPIMSWSIKNHLMRVFEGLQGLTNASGLFGDVLSYLRLFALGLSSAKLSQTFNDLGASAWDRAGFGVIAAIGIVLLGHTLNIVLAIMSGVVHGLRLNCIEFFKWSLPDEGYSYKAFAKKARHS